MSSDEFSEAPGSAGARARSTLVAMEVLFRHTAKLGVRLRANGHGRSGARVVGFEPTPDGQPSIAERTGHVHVGDVLLAVNGVRVSHLPLREIVKVAARAHQPLKLVVGRRIRRQPRPRHATWRSSSGSIVRTQPELLWAPSDAPEKEVDRFLDLVRQRCPQCPEDEALSALRKANMEVDRALDSLASRSWQPSWVSWRPAEEAAFVRAIRQVGKNFVQVQMYLPERTVRDVVEFYYGKFKRGPQYQAWYHRHRRLRLLTTPDFHDDACCRCRHAGELLLCDTCHLAFHLHCAEPPLAAVPAGHWSCNECVARFGGNPRLLRLAREEVNYHMRQIRRRQLAAGAPRISARKG